MSENEKRSGSFEIKKINASTLNEFNEKVEELTRGDGEVFTITAIVIIEKRP